MRTTAFNIAILAVCVIVTCTAQVKLNAQHSAELSKTFDRPLNKIYVIAHRGVHGHIPENSLPAYQKGIDIGCDFVEIDARITKDGKLVSFHNGNLEGYGIKGSVKDYTLSELREIDIGRKYGKQWQSTKIPTVDEILQLCKGRIHVYLDVKTAPLDSLMSHLKTFGMENQVVWYIPFSHFDDIPNLDFNSFFRNSFLMPDPGDSQSIDSVFARTQVSVIASDVDHIDAEYVQKVHSHHALIFVDDKLGTIEEWKKMIALGVDGIQTDRPQELITFLKE